MLTQTTIPLIYTTYGDNMTIKSVDEVSDDSKYSSELGKNEFLKLLLAQLQHQDPLNPADNTEFIAQLAQFSSLEQMTQMNTTLEESLMASQSMSQAVTNAMIISYFDKNVTVETNEFLYMGEDGETSDLIFELSDPVLSGTLQIMDSNENIVLSVPVNNLEEGLNGYRWDGYTNQGVQAGYGIYTYEVVANDYNGGEVEATYLYNDVVNGIGYKDGMPYLNLSGVEVPFSSVRAIASSSVEK